MELNHPNPWIIIFYLPHPTPFPVLDYLVLLTSKKVVLLWNILTCWRQKLRLTWCCDPSFTCSPQLWRQLKWSSSGYSLVSKFLKERQIILTLIFCFWIPQPQNILNLFLFFTNCSLVVITKFVGMCKKSIPTFSSSTT